MYSSPGLLLRFRPFDGTEPSGDRRIDALIGRRWGAWNTYLYWKADNRDRSWLGTRVDTSLKSMGGRMTVVLQARGFIGLSGKSPGHFYLISNLLYALDSRARIRPGALAFYKNTAGGNAVLYFGPSLTLRLHSHLGARLSYGPDWLGGGGLLYFKLYLYL